MTPHAIPPAVPARAAFARGPHPDVPRTSYPVPTP